MSSISFHHTGDRDIWRAYDEMWGLLNALTSTGDEDRDIDQFIQDIDDTAPGSPIQRRMTLYWRRSPVG